MTGQWPMPAGLHSQAADLPVEGRLASFDGATGWLNSDPLTPAALLGKVVLVDFWTYTCVNWLRQLPYVRAWADRYAEHGLVVVGVHTPEFGFERDVDNIRAAVELRRITYPVAIDSRYGVWQAFDNHFWPALYFADAQGRIRHHHYGEGEYEQSEMVHPAAARRGRRQPGPRAGVGRAAGAGGRGRLVEPADTGDVHRVRARRGLRVAGGAAAGQAAVVHAAVAAEPERVGAVRRVDDRGAAGDSRHRREAQSPSASTPATSTW